MNFDLIINEKNTEFTPFIVYSLSCESHCSFIIRGGIKYFYLMTEHPLEVGVRLICFLLIDWFGLTVGAGIKCRTLKHNQRQQWLEK